MSQKNPEESENVYFNKLLKLTNIKINLVIMIKKISNFQKYVY